MMMMSVSFLLTSNTYSYCSFLSRSIIMDPKNLMFFGCFHRDLAFDRGNVPMELEEFRRDLAGKLTTRAQKDA